MNNSGTHACAICGDEGIVNDHWFLIAENRWEDNLKIFQWDDELATHRNIQRACSPAHVQELVVHWMTTGGLDYPFARVMPGSRPARRGGAFWTAHDDLYTSGTRPIGELAVHRESMKRALSESPQSLKAILDALLGVLELETTRSETEVEEDELLYAVSREV
jgi:hypothetical protein